MISFIDSARNRVLNNHFYPCFLSKEVGNLYCGTTIPIVHRCLEDNNVPAICKGFQVYNSTKEILRPSKEVQPYYNASITNQLGLRVDMDKVIEHIDLNRSRNQAKINFVAARSNGMH